MLRFFLFFIVSVTSSLCGATQIYGHRGAAGLAPENTIPAYQKALEYGVDAIDMDVGLTKDGVVVVYHDMTLNPELTRLEDGSWLTKKDIAIQHLTLSDLKTYDVGRINPNSETFKLFPDQKPMEKIQIPSLKEVIQFAKKNYPNLKLQIEIKSDPLQPEISPAPEEIIPAVLKILKEEKVSHLTEIHSYDWRNLFLLEKLAPSLKRSFITQNQYHGLEDGTWTTGPLLNQEYDSFPKLIKALKGDIWCPLYTEVTQADIELAHELGLKVNVWSVDKVEEMMEMIAIGVDGIITNRPDILSDLLKVSRLSAYKYAQPSLYSIFN